MTEPLFLEPDVTFEKIAAEVMLPEDANEWPNELMQELFKQCPFVADFEPHVVMDRVDAERGFGFGHVEIQNKTEVQHGAAPDAMQAAGIKSARIPIVIKDRKLQPLDLLVTADSTVLPLTESRLRQAIFRPQVFDITGRGPGDMSMIGQLYPPYRQNFGFGGGGASMSTGMGKEGEQKEAISAQPIWNALRHTHEPEALSRFVGKMGDLEMRMADAAKKTPITGRLQGLSSAAQLGAMDRAKAIGAKLGAAENPAFCSAADAWGRFDKMVKSGSVLAAILPTINESDYNAFFQKVSSDRGLQAQYVLNGPATGDAIKMLSSYEPGSARKLASAVLEHLKPTVVQLRKEEAGYSLKTAAHNCWVPEVQHLDRGQAVKMLGAKIVLAADTTGAATMTLGEGVSEPSSPEADTPDLVSQFGIYKVQDEQGRHLIGYVFPNLIDVDGTVLPVALFTNGSQMAVQGEIAGISAGSGASLFEGHPRGKGVFYHLLANGRAEATIPFTVKATMASPEEGGVVLHAETFDGREVQVSVQPNLENVTPSPDGMLLIPDSFSWLPLDEAEETALVGDPESFSKEAQASRALASVEVRCGSDSFSVRGFPVEKLAADEKSFLSLDDTMFLLGGLGADLDYVQQKLGHAAARSAPVQVRVGRYIKTAGQRLDEATEKAAQAQTSFTDVVPELRKSLIKEAAVIPDPVAVDTVLSLGFLNSENLGIFISYLPTIDTAQHKMCELLLAARLGLREVPVSALEKSIRSTEEVLEGLKILAFQNS